MTQESSPCPAPAAQPVDWKGTARYEVLSCLGRGGMGVVYEAFDRERRQLVAVKTLLNYDPAALYLFKQEFRALADLLHINLVQLHELVVPDDDQVFFTMELLRGTGFLAHVRPDSLHAAPTPPMAPDTKRPTAAERDTIRPAPGGGGGTGTKKRLLADQDRLRPALRQLVQGANALHVAGKLHRDLKPSNVLVTAQGRVVLLDFGVATDLGGRGKPASLGGSGEVVGTARYMAPEQADDGPPTAASDWYSVGVMLYEALVGRPPFTGSLIDVLTLKSTVDPLPPSELVEGVPSDLDALCMALLHRDPTMRPGGDEILKRLGIRTSSAPPQVSGPTDAITAFVGREKQLLALREAFEATRSGTSMTVRVGGLSGMGKSTIVHHFLNEVADGADAVVLRGRAYEREAVPYKAVDSVMDALSRHLLDLIDLAPEFTLPGDMWALARVFPVLQRIPGAEHAAQLDVDDPQAVRRRAFSALRELLSSLARRQPLVLFLDDVHWGDVDSAALVLDLLRGPDAAPLLIVMTFRDNEAHQSPFLVELQERWPEGARVVDVEVGPLKGEDAQRLALSLLNDSDDASQRVARAVARESRGSPFLIEELVRSNRGVLSASGATLAVITLDQMVSDRLERLPDSARRLIEIIAVGGRPLPVSVTGAAADIRENVNEAIALLGTRRFARTGQREGRDVVETTHDRIRETVVALLPPATLRGHHRALARALEAAPGTDAEAIALHWLGGGDAERAVHFAEDAAERSVKTLAFDHAARLFRLALENTPPASDHAQALRLRLATALQQGGRYGESARAYIEAAAAAPGEQRLEFQRAAAEQCLAAGQIDEGTEMLYGVLAAVGIKAPRSQLAALFWLILYRIWLAILGPKVRERERSEVSQTDRVRIDALFTAAVGFPVVNSLLGACMTARHLILALRRGDRFQLMRAASLEASILSAAGGPETFRERALVETSQRLAAREDTPAAHAYADGARGIGLFLRGRFREARESLDRGQAVPQYGNAGFSSVRLFSVYTMVYLGDFDEGRRRMAKLLVEAEDRGDKYTLVNLNTSMAQSLAFAADDPERGRRIAREALAQWPQRGFFVQHWQAVVYGADGDMYVGDVDAGCQRLEKAMPDLKKSFLLHSYFVRVMTCWLQGRLAIASIPSHPAERGARLAEARRLARRLEREADAWPKSLGAQIRAGIAVTEGDRVTAIAELRLALGLLGGEPGMYAWIVGHRLGLLLGGDDGSALVREALETMRAQGIRNPARWLSVYLPGEWGSAGAPGLGA